jgi:dolichol-phosphate mannosyltransferase
MLGRRFSRSVCRCEIQDPMSGFFMLTRQFLLEVVHGVSAIGFKILVDLLASSKRSVRLKEIPYRFRARVRGESKLDILVGIEYLLLLLDKTVGDYIPPKFILFALVGCAGAAIQLSLLWVLLSTLRVAFGPAIVIATGSAMSANFLLNNVVTYRDERLSGFRMLQGLILFCITCSVGLLISYKTAEFLKTAGAPWHTAGILGLAIGSVWNYGVSRISTWRSHRSIGRSRAGSRLNTAAIPEGCPRS